MENNKNKGKWKVKVLNTVIKEVLTAMMTLGQRLERKKHTVVHNFCPFSMKLYNTNTSLFDFSEPCHHCRIWISAIQGHWGSYKSQGLCLDSPHKCWAVLGQWLGLSKCLPYGREGNGAPRSQTPRRREGRKGEGMQRRRSR